MRKVVLITFILLVFSSVTLAAVDLSSLNISKPKIAIVTELDPKIQTNRDAVEIIAKTINEKFAPKYSIVGADMTRNQWVEFSEKNNLTSVKSAKRTDLQLFAKEYGYDNVLAMSCKVLESHKDISYPVVWWISDATATFKVVAQEGEKYLYFDDISAQGRKGNSADFASENSSVRVAVKLIMQKFRDDCRISGPK